MRLEEKSIVVTGASSGIGREIVRLFVKEGARVVAVARRKERLEELAASLADETGAVEIFVGDICKQETNEAMIDFAVKRFGKLDVLVNGAGVMDDMSPIGEFANERLELVFSANVFGPMYAMRKAVQIFREQGCGGNILNIASLGGMRTCAGAVYCASKAAVISLTKNTAFMYQKNNIRVNAIAPGLIMTEIADSMGTPNDNGFDNLQKILSTNPGPGEPEQVASAALFLVSDESSFVNGDVLLLDGGWNAG
jgi:NAD(P)-dependent dehydrogenase (short-subunit alcohol dehydrogenase family)